MVRVLEHEVNLSRRACWNNSKKLLENDLNDNSLDIKKTCRMNHNECYVRTKLFYCPLLSLPMTVREVSHA